MDKTCINLSLGLTVATPAALRALAEAGETFHDYLLRHKIGDWGTVGTEDWKTNNWAAANGERILSAYLLPTRVKIWIITEWDRSVTTVLLPDDY
jgi:hypothetical protein